MGADDARRRNTRSSLVEGHRMSNSQPTRDQIEEFLYHEAELIDDWRLPEWAGLYTDDARYDATPLDSDDPINSSSKDSLFLLADDKERLTSRAKRLMKK